MTVLKVKFGKMVGRAEDPRELLDYSYEKQLELLQRVRKGIADVATSKARLKLQAGRMEEQVAKLDTQARKAISVSREDLARLALERKKNTQSQLQSIDAQVTQIEGEEDKLKQTEAKLQSTIEAFRTRKETTKARYTAAEAQVRIGEAVSGLSNELGDIGMALDRAEQKTEELQARAMAVDELLASGAIPDLTAPPDMIERELQKGQVDSDVELELAELKKELGPGTAEEAQSSS